jgi:phosphatidylinositol-3-phosphatase
MKRLTNSQFTRPWRRPLAWCCALLVAIVATSLAVVVGTERPGVGSPSLATCAPPLPEALLRAQVPAPLARRASGQAPIWHAGGSGLHAGALDRVAVLVLENRSYGQVIGDPRAPFLNHLARSYALAVRYYAIGHPSLPNYMALTSGSTRGLSGDAACEVERPNLVDELDRAGISWKAYFQSLPRVGYLGGRTHHLHARAARYTRLDNPFVYFEQVAARPADRARLVPMSQLKTDLDHRALPRFSWIAPNLHDDGHNGSIATADHYLRRLVPRLLRALGRRGALFITWDEGRRPDDTGMDGAAGGGHVPLIVAGEAVNHHVRVTAPATHYTLLAAIEHIFAVRTLGRAAHADVHSLLANVFTRASALGA